MEIELISKVKSFNGYQKEYKHFSKETKCLMKFSVYEPYYITGTADVLYMLPGLTNDVDKFVFSTGFQKFASENGFIVVVTDTSPRGLNLPGETDSIFLGESAGAYLDATQGQWAKNYRMYSYVSKELPAVINANFPTSGRNGICGHSMGGHGALMIGLRNPETFHSISALAPITNPAISIWAFEQAWIHYLGDSKEAWLEYDSCEIAKKYSGPRREILIDQGTADELIQIVLFPENFREAVASNPERLSLELKYREGYDHSSTFFLKTFIEDHFLHHARILRSKP